ncbi:uncharacterized protein THITE_2171570 [Thermothielavioides terrestris NRRL 8126]|uniref:Uncharacterized protein n=1 Tax=Thermothielavioides terrestris (strain ATCC 38088 / NRRL 8126) TaxID=578455 RepID=G2RHN4_THETT|nr:uncharacterized protein THITE_2171570 [Thermothielavioides terrestris NRRL 8126]AEO71346.1 hypothetical protein THITE_2171570 [Thermothielavioides terrestris NRRL 8126]
MSNKYFSPYAPRRPRSPRLVILWLTTFALVLWLTWYVSTRHRERAAPYVDEFLHPGGGAARRGVGAAKEARGEGRGLEGGGAGEGSV